MKLALFLFLMASTAVAIQTDKVAHFGTSAVLVLTIDKVFRPRSAMVAPLAAFALGIAKEFLIDPHADPLDVLANTGGITWAILYLNF